LVVSGRRRAADLAADLAARELGASGAEHVIAAPGACTRPRVITCHLPDTIPAPRLEVTGNQTRRARCAGRRVGRAATARGYRRRSRVLS